MVDPLVMTLRGLQAAADNQGSKADIRWQALRNQGVPVGYPEFAARWDDEGEQGILRKLVQKFDSRGLTLKTKHTQPQPAQGGEGGPDLVSQMAKSATDKAMAQA